ncbi:putative mediator complex, subunit Med11 [Helianthus annuus]|nr:putative mediator complex, subunit Med11 [Helianthus annuus]KAJ0843456.1 putative mediator complex, subunit Med11 [Helianthus annuus]
MDSQKQNEACNWMDSQKQNASLQRLQTVDKFAIPSGPRKELINNHCSEFMQLIKLDIQVTLREEIKSACEYRPFEKCDYIAQISNEICCKKVEYVIEKLKAMKETIDAPYIFHLSEINKNLFF